MAAVFSAEKVETRCSGRLGGRGGVGGGGGGGGCSRDVISIKPCSRWKRGSIHPLPPLMHVFFLHDTDTETSPGLICRPGSLTEGIRVEVCSQMESAAHFLFFIFLGRPAPFAFPRVCKTPGCSSRTSFSFSVSFYLFDILIFL